MNHYQMDHQWKYAIVILLLTMFFLHTNAKLWQQRIIDNQELMCSEEWREKNGFTIRDCGIDPFRVKQ
jgi:hypothetical protein